MTRKKTERTGGGKPAKPRPSPAESRGAPLTARKKRPRGGARPKG